MTTPTSDRPLALVTGASSGIGYELAAPVVEHGFDLVIAAEDDGIETAAQKLRRDGGPAPRPPHPAPPHARPAPDGGLRPSPHRAPS